MTTIQRAFAILMLVVFVTQAGAGVRYSMPGADVDGLHQQGTENLLEEEEEEDEDEEPDCE